MTTALVPYDATLQARAGRWVDLAPDDRRRKATAAAQTKDAAELWSLLEAYLATYGAVSAKLSPYTLRSYHYGLTAFLTYANTLAFNLIRVLMVAQGCYGRGDQQESPLRWEWARALLMTAGAYLRRRRLVSMTVVRGYRRATQGRTNRPVIALRYLRTILVLLVLLLLLRSHDLHMNPIIEHVSGATLLPASQAHGVPGLLKGTL